MGSSAPPQRGRVAAGKGAPPRLHRRPCAAAPVHEEEGMGGGVVVEEGRDTEVLPCTAVQMRERGRSGRRVDKRDGKNEI